MIPVLLSSTTVTQQTIVSILKALVKHNEQGINNVKVRATYGEIRNHHEKLLRLIRLLQPMDPFVRDFVQENLPEQLYLIDWAEDLYTNEIEAIDY
jgi:hypothetical protein